MKFLVISRNRHVVPMELAASIFDAALDWYNRYSANGKIQEAWNFAGVQAGGGILNAESAEEANQILGEFPLAPFSETEVIPLVDITTGFKQQKQIVQMMMQQMQMKAGVR